MTTIRPLFKRALIAAAVTPAALSVLPILSHADAAVGAPRIATRAAPAPANIAASYDAQFSRFDKAPGWIAGDGARAIALPDGRTLWMFGDSNVGRITAKYAGSNGSLRQVGSTWVNNSLVVTDGRGTFTSLYRWDPVTRQPSAYFAPTGLPAGHYYWMGAGIVEPTPAGNVVQIVLMDVAPAGTAPSTGRRIATLDPSTLAIRSISAPLPAISYTDPASRTTGPAQCGNALLHDGGFTYLYCEWSQPGWSFNRKSIVVRTPDGDLTRTARWQVDAGNGAWTSDLSKAVAGADYALNSVIKLGNRYVTFLIQSNETGAASKQIRAYASARPNGPWTVAASTPAWTYDIPAAPSLGLVDPYRAYLPVAHPELATATCLPVSWSNDVASSWADMAKKIGYRPRFTCLNPAGL